MFFSQTSFLSGGGGDGTEIESKEFRVREEMGGGRNDEEGKGGGVFNMGEKSMYI